jgi:HSP20 family protein
MKFLASDEMFFMADVFEEGNDVVVKADMPGVKKEDVSVSLSDDAITIRGERKKEEKVERKDYYRVERSYGSFTRSFRLPADVQTDKAEAKFGDGVLEIRIPKMEEAVSKTKKVPIK